MSLISTQTDTLLFVALVQRPAELALSFPRYVPTMIKDPRVPSTPKPTTFPIGITDVHRLSTLAHRQVGLHVFGRRHCVAR